MFAEILVWVRGTGELGSAVAHLLHRVGFSVFLSEISPPLAIRRAVCFSRAILEDESEVEGVVARYINGFGTAPIAKADVIPLYKDTPQKLMDYKPSVLIDARMIKHYNDDFRSWADLVIGLGPGFNTSSNCDLIIETKRGHDLGRVITSGKALSNTGIPGNVGGETANRLIKSPTAGLVSWQVDFGELVSKGQQLGDIDQSVPIYAPLDGMVRGMISPETPVTKNMKIGDIDPRGSEVRYLQISDKARMIASGVLEAIVLHLNVSTND
ncbi:EF2563 family selenium-dependent molybdenum hydroxylase system protein [bacterium]|nr:EF2563 family selenium-dependent molybdenum hydroxylase system protein [bacterium]